MLETDILLDSCLRRNDELLIRVFYWLALSKNFFTLSNQLLALGR